MPSDYLYINDYRLQTAGNVELSSAGDHFTIYATDSESLLSLRSQGCIVVGAGGALLTLDNNSPTGGAVTMQAGAQGTVKLGVGLPLIGAQATLDPEQITLSVGPPGVGAAIKMTPTSITFQVAETSYEMTPTGIVEKMGATQRELSPIGHTMSAAETELGVAVQGVSYSGPMVQTSSEAVTETSGTLTTCSSDAMKQEQNGMLMLA